MSELKTRSATVTSFALGSQEWLGVAFPFDALKGEVTRFLVAIPGDDLLGDIKAKRQQLIWLLVGLTALLLPLGWWAALWRDAELAYWQDLAKAGHSPAKAPAFAKSLARTRDARLRALQDDFAFVAQCNIGGEFMPDADIARLATIGKTIWLRHFDNRLGLFDDENLRLAALGPAAALPALEPLLADRPEHVIPWGGRRPSVERGDEKNLYGFDMALPAHLQNMGEPHNLSTRKGTLTEEDRFGINDHIVQTLVMLRNLPWPAHLARVPDIAASHHERMDGQGYPRRLAAEQLTLADRVMALADIFEALTAADRPYKTPKTLTESLKIMALMAKDGHIDVEIFR